MPAQLRAPLVAKFRAAKSWRPAPAIAGSIARYRSVLNQARLTVSLCIRSPTTIRLSARIMCASVSVSTNGSPETDMTGASTRLNGSGSNGQRSIAKQRSGRAARTITIWHEAQDPRGTLAQTYLNVHRKLDLDDDLAGGVLRFHPTCPWRNETTGKTDRVPALIAAFRSIDDGTITAIHRIALNGDGTKLSRRMLGVVHRAAVMLDPIGRELAIGEGIETCMAARQLGVRPTWALGSTGSITGFPILDGVKTLNILGETGEASRQAIDFCARRWKRVGRRVRYTMPDIGDDLNDELMAAAQ
jgi:hypothetical protein